MRTSLPGIWMDVRLAVVFTLSVLIWRPAVGVVWACLTGRALPRAVPPLRQRPGGIAGGRAIAMGYPVFVVTTTVIYLSIRAADRALTVSET